VDEAEEEGDGEEEVMEDGEGEEDGEVVEGGKEEKEDGEVEEEDGEVEEDGRDAAGKVAKPKTKAAVASCPSTSRGTLRITLRRSRAPTWAGSTTCLMCPTPGRAPSTAGWRR
jgi:hypothetical protein